MSAIWMKASDVVRMSEDSMKAIRTYFERNRSRAILQYIAKRRWSWRFFWFVYPTIAWAEQKCPIVQYWSTALSNLRDAEPGYNRLFKLRQMAEEAQTLTPDAQVRIDATDFDWLSLARQAENKKNGDDPGSLFDDGDSV